MATELESGARRQRVHDTFDRLIERLLTHDMNGFADLWAPDGTMDFPFAPPGWPQLRSREDVRAYVADYTGMADLQAVTHQRRHETSDPDTLIVEWGVDGTAVATGRPYRIDYVAVLTVGEQGIEVYRDYWSALALGHVVGELDEMARAYDRADTAREVGA